METHAFRRSNAHRIAEARLCRQMGAPPEGDGGMPMRGPREGPPRQPWPMEADARLRGAANANEQTQIGLFMREAQFFMMNYNAIPRMYPNPQIAQAHMIGAIQAANRELLTRHQTIRGYPLFVIQPTPQGLVAVMNGSRMIPMGGPQMGPGGPMMTVGGMAPMPNMFPEGMTPESPPMPMSGSTWQMVRTLYASRRPERMNPEQRYIWQQTIIAGLELMGYSAPVSFENAFVRNPPTERVMMAGSRGRGFNQLIGVIRLIGVAVMTSEMRRRGGGRPTEGAPEAPVDPRGALDQYQRNADRPIDLTLEPATGAITKLTMRPRTTTDGLAADKVVTKERFTEALTAEGLRAGTDYTVVDAATGKIELVNPTAERLQKVMAALRRITPPDIMPGTPENRINAYKDNPRRKVNVERTPATGTPITQLKLTPITTVTGPVTQAELRRLLTAQGVPDANIANDGTTGLLLTGAAVNATNLPKVATVLEALVLAPASTTPESPASREVSRIRKSKEEGDTFLEHAYGAVWDAADELWTVTLETKTLKVRFDEGAWKFKNAAGDWKNVTGNTVVTADIAAGTPDSLVARFNNEIVARLRGLDGGDATVTQAVEKMNKSQEKGATFLGESYDATWVPADKNYEVVLEGKTLKVRFEEGAWKFKNAAGDWKNVTGNNVVAADVGGAAETLVARFNTEIVARLRGLDGGDATAVEKMNKSKSEGRTLLMAAYGARWNNADKNYEVVLEGKTLKVRFDEGSWKFKNAAGDWKNVTGNNVVAADVGGAAETLVARFNTEIVARLRGLDGGDATAVEKMNKSKSLGDDLLKDAYRAVWVPADKNYEVALEGKTLKVRFDEGSWKFKNAAGDWKNVTGNNVVAADVGGAAETLVARFNTEIVARLRGLDGGDAAVTQAVERIEKNRVAGSELLSDNYGATWIAAEKSYEVTLEGKAIRFRFDEGSWKFKNAAGEWKNVVGNTPVAADAGGASERVLGRINTEITARLRGLDGGDATVTQAVEKMNKARTDGESYLELRLNAKWIPADKNYEVTLEGKTLKVRFDEGSWKFKNAAGTFVNVTGNDVVAADVGGGATDRIVGRFNTEVLTPLRNLQA